MLKLVDDLLWRRQRSRTVLWGGRPCHDTNVGGPADRFVQRLYSDSAIAWKLWALRDRNFTDAQEISI